MSTKVLKGVNFQSSVEKMSVGEFFFKYSERYASNICQVDVDRDLSETYHSIQQKSIRVAIQLQKKNITSEDVVAFLSSNTIDNLVAIIACFYLGAKVVSLDPGLTVRNIKYLLSVVSPTIIFVEESFLWLILESLKHVDFKYTVVVYGESEEYDTFSGLMKPDPNEGAFRPVLVSIHDTAILFFSSGTEGLPKAICHSHYSMLQEVEIWQYYFSDLKTLMHFTTLYWSGAVARLMDMFLSGGTLMFCKNPTGEKVFKMIEKYKLAGIFMTSNYIFRLTKVDNPQQYDTSSLRFVFTGGSYLSNEQFKKLDEMFKNAHILLAYGMTESGLISIFNPSNNKHLIKTKISSCGRIAPKVTLRIVKQNTDDVLGANEVGEIRVKSPGLMTGYYNRDSGSCFDGEGYLKTGDLGYYDDDGCIYVQGRCKEMFKYDGWHIVPSSIEAVLLEHPAVFEAVVYGIPQGDIGELPAAAVVLKSGAHVKSEEISKFVEESVLDSEKLRGGIKFVEVLPKTPTGKYIRREMRDLTPSSSN